MSGNLEKIASQVPGVLKEAASHMRKLANDNVALHTTNTKLSHDYKALKLALRMEERGLEPMLTREMKVSHLQGLSAEKLATVESAVEMAAGGFRLGAADTEDKLAAKGTSTRDELEEFVASQQAFTGSI